jgi:lipid II:glycine glycyltransferase (peptidoglycan interpeptide bridge formation enzyme)
MERNQAVQRYLFPVDYFMAFFEQMPGNARFTLAEYKDQIVAGTLYLHDDINVYSYLGGADHAFQNVRPTNAVIYETIRWAQSQGKRRLILGGGYRPDDGIFRFKASFSPLRAKFHIYRRIHLPDVYVSLCNAWSAYYHSDVNLNSYFPAYRSIPVGTEEEP